MVKEGWIMYDLNTRKDTWSQKQVFSPTPGLYNTTHYKIEAMSGSGAVAVQFR